MLLDEPGFLLPLVVLLPIVGAFIVYLFSFYSSRLRNLLTVIISALTLIIVLFLYDVVQQGEVIYELQGILDFGLLFYLDKTAIIFSLIITFIWFLSIIYMIDYMKIEKHQNRFYFFILLTLGGALGTVMTGNLFSLFVFFEIMSIASYVLIVHEEDLSAIRAANKYLFMAVAGGLLLLMGIVLLYHYTGSLHISQTGEQLNDLGNIKYLIGFLFIAGFGVKAGMFPVHIWLPEAHPVAPTPASALLSAVMIKIGAYGLIRTVNIIFTPDISTVMSSFQLSSVLGYTVILLGIISMFLGAFLALFETSMKKILAYSSISQMGYILIGLGAAAYLGTAGSSGMEGSLYHIINHALFKSSLFLIAGMIFYNTHELDINKLGGLYKKMPFTAIAFLVAMAGIVGLPGFNGFVSKTILHEAIIEAHLLNGDLVLYYGEKIFKLTGIITVIYFCKFLFPVFTGKMSDKVKKISNNSTKMKISFGIISLLIIIIGLFPNLILEKLISPALTEFNFNTTGDIKKFAFKFKEIKKAMNTILLGGAGYYILNGTNLLAIRLPSKISIENLIYNPVYHFLTFWGKVFLSIFEYDQDKRFLKTTVKKNLTQFFSKIYFIKDFLKDNSMVKKIFFSNQKNSSKVIWDLNNLDFQIFVLVFVILIFFILFFPDIYF